MTETAGARAGVRKGPRGKGVKVERIFTTPGVHPYDAVTWEKRDVVQQNWKTGETIFDQRGVEFPDFWSVNASTIVTTKYFRGALGTDKRESSLKQLIDRVVLTYVKARQRQRLLRVRRRRRGVRARADPCPACTRCSRSTRRCGSTWAQRHLSRCRRASRTTRWSARRPGWCLSGKLVEHNAVGTKVYDAHGLTRIVATEANGAKEVLRLHTKAGYTLDVTADHLVWKCSGEGTGRFVHAGDLRPGDQLEWHRREAFGENQIDPPRSPRQPWRAGCSRTVSWVGQRHEPLAHHGGHDRHTR